MGVSLEKERVIQSALNDGLVVFGDISSSFLVQFLLLVFLSKA